MTDEEKKNIAWRAAQVVEGFNADLYRKDACGAWIIWDKYGDTNSIYGWQVDHICPQSLLSSLRYSQETIDNEENLRALQHQNNVSKGDDYPGYVAAVTSEEKRNVEKRIGRTVNANKQAILKQIYSRLP